MDQVVASDAFSPSIQKKFDTVMVFSPDGDDDKHTFKITSETVGSVSAWFGCALNYLKIAPQKLVKPRPSHEFCHNLSSGKSDGERSSCFFTIVRQVEP